MSKITKFLLIILLIVILMGIGGFFGFKHFSAAKSDNKEPTLDEIVKKLTVNTDEITTNLADDSFIKIQFTIQVSSEEAKTELEKRMFQTKNEILYQLSGMKASELQGSKGMSHLEASLKERINKVLEKGEVTRVYTTEKVIQ